MRTISIAAGVAALVVALVGAQSPTPKPPDSSQAKRDAIKKQLEEKEAELGRARDARRSFEDEQAHPSPSSQPVQPPVDRPPSKDDDYLDDAALLLEQLLRSYGFPVTASSAYESLTLDADYERAKAATPPDQAEETRKKSDQTLSKLEQDRATLQQEYLDAGGRLGISQFTIETQTDDPELKRLEEEYIAKERKRLQEEEASKNKKPPPPGPPPPPPPISLVVEKPIWDVASSHGISGSSFGLTPSYQINFVADVSTTNIAMLSAPVDPTTQGKDAFLEELDGITLVVEPAVYWTMPQQDSAFNWPQPSRSIFAALRRPHVALRANLRQGSIAMARPQPSAKVFFTDLGGSTGDTIRMTVVNDGNVPVRIASDGFALVPVANMTAADVERDLRRLADKPQKTVTVRAYCRDLLKAAPVAGRVMRLADASVQAQMAPFQRVLAASRQLLNSGVLRPDIDDREQYLDSVRQWARWTMAQKFNQGSFTTAFIEHTKKNTIAAGQKWERSFDAEARQIATERWRDVQRVLAEASIAK